jgi:hypothetical protein
LAIKRSLLIRSYFMSFTLERMKLHFSEGTVLKWKKNH